VLASLANGATGIWCGVSREGAAVGHCCSAVTLANLHRLGNEHVARTYNLPAVRAAAVEVTRITTGRDPHEHEEVYGARAMDVVFDDDGGMSFASQQLAVAAAMGATVRNRVTTFTSSRMFVERMETLSPSPLQHPRADVGDAAVSVQRSPSTSTHVDRWRAGARASPTTSSPLRRAANDTVDGSARRTWAVMSTPVLDDVQRPHTPDGERSAADAAATVSEHDAAGVTAEPAQAPVPGRDGTEPASPLMHHSENSGDVLQPDAIDIELSRLSQVT
jgi:hypothetical protein